MVMQGKTYQVRDLEMRAENGSVLVRNLKTGMLKRIGVPDLKERMLALVSMSAGKRGESAMERDMCKEACDYVFALQNVIREAVAQGDVTDGRVLRSLCDEMRTSQKYTMKPKWCT